MGSHWDDFTNVKTTKSQVVNWMNSGVKFSSKGLMEFQDFICQSFTEAIRCLKPGGHALVWAIPRTSHHTAMGLERAGFEIRDIVTHHFGCLSEDTEILTINGWEHYRKNIDKYSVLCYNMINDTFEFHKPTRSFYYENQYPAYRIQSNNTDQIVSKWHRVIVERGGRKVFIQAEALQRQENIPFLESLSDLPETIYDFQSHTSVTKQVLLSMSKENHRKMEQGEIQKRTINLQILWGKIQTKIFKLQKNLLFFSLCWENTCLVKKIFKQRERNKKSQKISLWFKQSCLERWCNLFQNARKLCWSKICSLPERVFGYGSKGWICYGTPFNNGPIIEQMPFKVGNGTSYQSQSCRQQNGEPSTIQKQSGTQKIRRTKATITQIPYNGNVWCIEVPTGAFVARRNGKIFITGNSGFPKSYNIPKGIDAKIKTGKCNPESINRTELDKDTGQEVIRIQPNGGILGRKKAVLKKENAELETPEAKEWNGWGTALKPASEHWILCRKPISEKTIVENCLKWGVGGLNIDECRISTTFAEYEKLNNGRKSNRTIRSGPVAIGYGLKPEGLKNTEQNHNGRFPANLILTCTCDEVIKKGKAGTPYKYKDKNYSEQGFMSNVNAEAPYNYNDSGKQIIHTNPNCPCAILDRQSGQLKSGNNCVRGQDGYFGTHGGLGKKGDIQITYGDTGGASRFFYCAKASRSERNAGLEGFQKKQRSEMNKIMGSGDSSMLTGSGNKRNNKLENNHPTVKSLELMKYLVKLISREGQVVLDPFAGSGSTLIACRDINRNFIGIEKEADYVEIAEARLKRKQGILF